MCEVIAQCRMHNTNVFEVRGNIFDPVVVEKVDCLSIWYKEGFTAISASVMEFVRSYIGNLFRIQTPLPRLQQYQDRIRLYDERFTMMPYSKLFYVLNSEEIEERVLDPHDMSYEDKIHRSISSFFDAICNIDLCQKIAMTGIPITNDINDYQDIRNEHAEYLLDILYNQLQNHHVRELYLVNIAGAGFNLDRYKNGKGLSDIE